MSTAVKFAFMVDGLVGKVLGFLKIKVEDQAVFLPLIDVWNGVSNGKYSVETELHGGGKGFISAPHVKLVKPDTVVYAAKVMVVVLPPFGEVPVRQFENRRREGIPSFVDVYQQVDVGRIDREFSDLNRIKKVRVEQFLFVEVDYCVDP